MNAWLDSDGAAARRYVHQLRLPNAGSRKVYCRILNAFQRFIAQQSPLQPMSRQIIEWWLRDRSVVWPFRRLTHHACLVDRFLDWLVTEGSLASNPLSQLRQEYGQTDTAPVVRALLDADPDSALEALRPSPRFASFLGPQMRDHIALMQAMGHRYVRSAANLLRFDRFLQNHPELADQPIGVLVQKWTGECPTAQRAWECLSTGRGLAKALRRNDPSIAIPAMDSLLTRRVRQQYRRPYIFTEQEVRQLLDAALSLPSPQTPLRPLSVYTMLVLAYCAGLRVGEISRLTVGDIDFVDQTLEIRETKFFKSRRVPLAPSVMAALQRYLDARRRAGAPPHASAGLFWHEQPAGHYAYSTIGVLLTRIFRKVGIKPQTGAVGPRIHDLRHSFVANRMLIWYRDGVNPQSKLPYLATYLGHKDINSTLVYLTVTQELLQQASDRFHGFAAEALDISKGARP
jgi:integrase/recombinase XerD